LIRRRESGADPATMVRGVRAGLTPMLLHWAPRHGV